MRLLFLRCFASFAVFSLAAGSPLAGQPVDFKPPPVDVPKARRGNLLPQDVAQIKARLVYVVKVVGKAEPGNADTIIAARKALTATFEKYGDHIYRYEVARQAAEVVAPTLALPGLLKQINMAMALSQMPYGTIQPALAKMVVHPNAAVRFLGWKGYRAVLDNGQLRDGPGLAMMFASLTARSEKDTSPRVLGAIWDVLALDRSGQAAVDRNHVRAMAILKAPWRRRCGKVLSGDAAVSEAVGEGITAAAWHTGVAQAAMQGGSDVPAEAKALRRDGAQMIIDMMYCAAKAYGQAFQDGQLDTPAAEAAERLLWESEKALTTVLQLPVYSQEGKFITGVLTTPALRKILPTAIIYHVNPRTKRKYGVLAWVGFLNEKGFGLETPTVEMFKPKVVPPAKPAPDKPAPDKPAPSKPAPSKPAPAKPKP